MVCGPYSRLPREPRGISLKRLVHLALVALALTGCASNFDDPGPRAQRPGGVFPQVVQPDRPLQCVAYVRAETGVSIWGDAWNWWEKAAGRYGRSDEPADGAVLVMKGYGDNGRGHVAVVRRVLSRREIVVDHANWLNGGEISLDSPVLDVSADNDWSRVRVWYTPGSHYGGRVYDVEGFILSSD